MALGFHPPRVYSKVLDIEACLLASPAMNQALARVRQGLEGRGLDAYSTRTHQGFLRHLVVRESQATGELMVNLITSRFDAALMGELDELLRTERSAPYTLVNGLTDRKSLVAFGDREEVISGPGCITERLGPFTFTISANSFFQTNTRQAEALYREAVDLAAPRAAQVVYDLYCGTGSLSLFLAREDVRVLGIEALDSAVRDAAVNAARNGMANCTFRQMDLRELGRHRAELEAFGLPDLVVTDPPRAGMHPKAVAALRDLAPRQIVYVSCKPASLARDARMLCEDGRYRLTRVRPVDMFPQTAHVESVALLERTDRG
jgi:23S rRNA (uracil1939-C5)-methyltransferase